MPTTWLDASHRKEKPRVIIALDLDNYYCAVERLLDPSLRGRPLAYVPIELFTPSPKLQDSVQQKNICATTYEARAFGVDKLCLIKDAKKMCPELVIVNGEDLTKYRSYSRQIFRLVKSICWGNIEKLGMDELFIDVTAMIDSHENDLADGIHGSKEVFFNLEKNRQLGAERKGFMYRKATLSGCAHSTYEASTPQDRQMQMASHLAEHIRDKIHAELGFTTSAGIAPNKLLAKLLASKNKPAKQTTWLNGGSMDERQARQDFLNPYVLQKIPGFGFRTLGILRHKLFAEPLPAVGSWTDAPEHVHPYEFAKESSSALLNYEFGEHRLYAHTTHTGVLELQENAANERQPLTVKLMLEKATLADLKSWFDVTVAEKLWALLHGDDEEAVQMAPDYPNTVSVEDTYYGFEDMEQVIKSIRSLALSLLNRLEIEFVEEPAKLKLSNAKVANPTSPLKPSFVRYATQIRLSTRFGRTNRTSKSATLPADTFDLVVSKEERVQQLVNLVLMPLILQATDKRDLHELRLLNLAATNFVAQGPPRSVKQALSEPPKAKKRQSEAEWQHVAKQTVDPDVLNELPAELREEVTRQLGLKKQKIAKGQQKVNAFFTKKDR